ncbi:MAG TPA: hypothetical protein VEF76_01660 [Patescibacteria group bacterium]|nr:hypothetical protein [Patescibacteria group bacterium]
MRQQQPYALPHAVPQADTLTKHFLMQFMHEFQRQKAPVAEARIYAAIEQTAGKTGSAPEVVARALVESGLRAPRDSFPHKFVQNVEHSAVQPKWTPKAATEQQRELVHFWWSQDNATTGYKRGYRFH